MTWRSVVDPRLSTRRERRSSQRRCGRQASAHCTPVKDCGPEMPASSARWKQQVSPSQGRLTRPPILWGDKVSPRGALRFMVVKGGVGAQVFIQFLQRLMHRQRRPVFLIVDGHPAHRSKLVKAYIESLAGKLRLFFLPPYSPELNPDELVWNDVKNNAVGRSPHDGPEDLRRAVLGRLRFLQKRPDRVRSFFQAPETRYAA
ncbi:transposase [Bradyrhizobium cenepequi]